MRPAPTVPTTLSSRSYALQGTGLSACCYQHSFKMLAMNSRPFTWRQPPYPLWLYLLQGISTAFNSLGGMKAVQAQESKIQSSALETMSRAGGAS